MRVGSQRIERLLNLLTFLLNSSVSKSAEEIRTSIPHYRASETQAAFKRTLGRDMQALREVGVPVEVDDGFNYRIEPKAYHLPLLNFTEEELSGLALASRIVSNLAPSLQEAAESALRKLSFGSWEDMRRAEENETDLEFQLLYGRGGLKPEKLQVLMDAVLNRHTVKVRYWARTSHQTTTRDVDPYGLVIHDGQWYLVGFCHLRGDVRTFKGIRIRSLSLSKPSQPNRSDFEIPQGFDLQAHVGVPRWSHPSFTPSFTAKVRFDKEVFWWVRENWGIYGSIEEEADAGILSVEVRDPDAFVDAILEFGRHAEVREPKSLRNKAISALERIVEAHR